MSPRSGQRGDHNELLSSQDLREKKGIRFTRQHLHRLVKDGKFPAPIKVGENTNAWVEPEIDTYIERCISKRDAATAA
jgi:prophage regulatory protein